MSARQYLIAAKSIAADLLAVMKKVETQVDRKQKVRRLLDEEDLDKIERAFNALMHIAWRAEDAEDA
jgi:hypothetical protein